MNIAFLSGNMGGILLSSKERNKKSFNGKQEPFSLLSLLANNNPQNNYFVFHKCGNYKKYINSGQYEKDFRYKNVYFITNEVRLKTKSKEYQNKDGTMSEGLQKELDAIVERVNELGGIDCGISFCDFANQLIPGTMRKVRNPKLYAKALVSFLSSVHSLYILEHFRFNYIVYAVDMRFLVFNSKNYTVPPKAIFGFENKKAKIELIKDFKEESYRDLKNSMIEYDVDLVYDGADLLTLCSKESIPPNDDIDINSKSGFAIYANQHKSNSFDRLKCIREFCKDIPIRIYGTFDEDSEYYGNDINPMLDREAMFNDMKNLKYTFIAPSNEGVTLTSAKYWESIHMKVIPFMHYNYGSEYWRKYHNIPEFLFVNSNKELKEKIEFLENNEDEYIKLVNQICNVLTEDDYNGKKLSEKVNNCLRKYCFN